ncbi:MAG: squalene/phytoene synthase family protein [Pseudomonadota bacterium]
MSAEACTELVRRADPDRWRAAMAATGEKRDGLMALYAFNLEIARAPWVASDPLLAQIRLQWWKDAIDEIYAGAPPRRHEVVEPLSNAILAAGLPRHLMDETIDARIFDADAAPFKDAAALQVHVDRTAGHIMVLAAHLLGANEAATGVIRSYAQGIGLAAFVQALPDYAARRRAPLPSDVKAPALLDLAANKIAAARSSRAAVPRDLLPALLPGVIPALRLKRARAARNPMNWRASELSEFERRAWFTWAAVTGRW